MTTVPTLTCDVLVAGGGPVGLAVAIGARRAGLRSRSSSRAASPVDKACGEGLMPAALRELARLGVEVEGRPFVGIRYLGAGPLGRGAVPGRAGARGAADQRCTPRWQPAPTRSASSGCRDRSATSSRTTTA